MALRIKNQLPRLRFLRDKIRHAVVPAELILPKKDKYFFIAMLSETGGDLVGGELFRKQRRFISGAELHFVKPAG